MQPSGIFIIAELHGEAADQIREINQRFDPRLARYKPPHITITGSSGAGPLPPSTDREELRAKLLPISESTPPLSLRFGPPIRFLQTDIVVLPLDPHGPLRTLHERIAGSGLPFARARFTFSPHCTLSLYPALTPERARELLQQRIHSPVVINALTVYLARDPQPAAKLLELALAVPAQPTHQPGETAGVE